MATPTDVYEEVRDERKYQDTQWGGSDHDDEHGTRDFLTFMLPYMGNAVAGEDGGWKPTPQEERKAMVKIAALAVANIERIDRQLGSP